MAWVQELPPCQDGNFIVFFIYMKIAIKKLDPALLPRMARVLKAVGHPLRLQLLERLAAGECSVRELVAALRRPQAIVSQHLKVMRNGGVVVHRREGTRVIYALAHDGLLSLLSCLATCQSHCLAPDTYPSPSISPERPAGSSS